MSIHYVTYVGRDGLLQRLVEKDGDKVEREALVVRLDAGQ